MLEPFKYGGYPMLLGAVTLPEDDTEDTGLKHFLAPEKAPLLQARPSSHPTNPQHNFPIQTISTRDTKG